MLITIEDFREEDFDVMLKILNGSFITVRNNYYKKQTEFAKEILLEHFLPSQARVAKYLAV